MACGRGQNSLASAAGVCPSVAEVGNSGSYYRTFGGFASGWGPTCSNLAVVRDWGVFLRASFPPFADLARQRLSTAKGRQEHCPPEAAVAFNWPPQSPTLDSALAMVASASGAMIL